MRPIALLFMVGVGITGMNKPGTKCSVNDG